MSLSGKNVVITGATSGFGVEIAKALSEAGASVFFGGRRADQGNKIAKEIGATFHVVDVASEESNKAFFEAAETHFGGQKVDFVHLNAGVEGSPEGSNIRSLDVQSYDDVFAVNVRGMMFGLQYGTKTLRKNGTLLVTSSTASLLPFPMNPPYVASKAAINSFVSSYAAQFAESEDERIKSLSILSLNPGVYATEMIDRFTGGNEGLGDVFAKMANPSQRLGQPDELAKIITDFVHGDLPYKNGDLFVADADTHYPLSEYLGRLQKAQA